MSNDESTLLAGSRQVRLPAMLAHPSLDRRRFLRHRRFLTIALLAAACLGSAAAPRQCLWRIGQPDTNTVEFALAPADYGQFEHDGFVIVGQSDPRQTWPYVHPGPEDTWAGSSPHTFRVAFGLKTPPPPGEARLVAGFVDTHSQKPPRLVARINGRTFEQALPKGGGNDSIEGRLDKAQPFSWQIKFPAELLKTGDNELSITTVSGSWALYDYLMLEAPPGAELAPVSATLAQRLAAGAAVALPAGPVQVTVNCGKVVNVMRGGLGASWHAIEAEIPYGVKHPVFTQFSHGGSGWGAYPPAEDERAWQQIFRHAEWLGLDWNRVEIEQRVYEPERNKFTFDNPEMRILYRILDWNQQHGADVFFQQMWCNAAWLAYPEFRDDPVGRVHSAPADLEAFADGLATLMEHLIKKRGYTCIKWLCIVNEPGAGFSWWQAPPNKALSIGPGLTAVRKALDQRGLTLPLSGPDTTTASTTAFPATVPGGFDYLDRLGAYDFHDYGADFDFRTKGHTVTQERNAAVWVKQAHQEGKPVFLSEFGTGAYGAGLDNPGPSSPQSVLAGSELVIRMANVGIDGFNRWSFLNRGDLDGQWQFVDTWDRSQKKLLADFPPHPNSYFCLGLLSRFTAKHSTVLASRVEGGKLAEWQRVFCCAFRSPGGNLTLAIVNDAPAEFQLHLALEGRSKPARFYRYRYGEAERDRADLKVNPQPGFSPAPEANEWQDSLPRSSLTIYSTYKLEHGAPSVMTE